MGPTVWKAPNRSPEGTLGRIRLYGERSIGVLPVIGAFGLWLPWLQRLAKRSVRRGFVLTRLFLVWRE